MSNLSTDLIARNHDVTINYANTLITNFESNVENIINGDYSESNPLYNSQSFNKDALQRVLDLEGCIGIRFYNGFDTNNKIVLVATGIDSEGNDLNLEPDSTSTDYLILQHAQPCPTICPAASKINT